MVWRFRELWIKSREWSSTFFAHVSCDNVPFFAFQNLKFHDRSPSQLSLSFRQIRSPEKTASVWLKPRADNSLPAEFAVWNAIWNRNGQERDSKLEVPVKHHVSAEPLRKF